jgi:hypothetical protein
MVTSVVLGDDVVSRFGLATATDLRSGSFMIEMCGFMLLIDTFPAFDAEKNIFKNLTTVHF